MVETNTATNINGYSAILNGNILECVGKVKEYGFYWGANETTPLKLTVGSADIVTSFSKELTGLNPGKYYFKSYAVNSTDTGYGKVNVFEIKADEAIKVVLDGQALTFDVAPVIENNRILVPFRVILQALGAEVQWNGETRTVTAVKDDAEIKLVIDGAVYINGEQVDLDVPAKIINDRTMVPLRFVSEALGCRIDWDGAVHTVNIMGIISAKKR